MAKTKHIITAEIEKQILELRGRGLSTDKIVIEVGFVKRSIEKVLRKNGIRAQAEITDEMRKEVIRLRTEEKLTFVQIGEKLGIGQTTAHRACIKNNMTKSIPKFTDEDKQKILELKDQGFSSSEIGKILNIGESSIRKLYKSLEIPKQNGGYYISKIRSSLTLEIENRIIELNKEGRGQQVIADILGLTRNHVRIFLKLKGIE